MLIHLRDRRGPAWFFNGQSGCYCCTPATGVYVVFYGLKQSPLTSVRDVDKYEIDTWTSKTDGTTPGRYYLGAASIAQVAYLFGGFSDVSPYYLANTQSYVQSIDTFTAKTAMTNHRRQMASMPIDDKAYSFAGFDGTSIRTRTNYQYTPSSDTWATKTDISTPARDRTAGCQISLKGYVFGGFDGTSALADNDQYDPSSDSWTAKADINTTGYDARGGHAAYSIDGKGYCTHGNTFPTVINEVAEYDPSADSWSAYTNTVTTARESIAGSSLGGTSPGYTTTGLTAASAASREHSEFTPTSWTSRTDIPTPARYAAIACESA